MGKNKIEIRSLLDKYQENCERIHVIADSCETEKRERTDAETAEYELLCRENQMLQMKLQAATAEHLRENPNAKADAEALIRENHKAGRKTEIVFMRDAQLMMVADAANGGIVPLNIGDIIKPLVEGFILDKVGLPLPTGLVGDYVWPSYELVEASIAGEGVALSDTKIPLSKFQAHPERVGIAVPVTNQALQKTDGILEMIIREVMPQSIKMLLNKVLFSTEAVNGATNLQGPFVGKVDTAKTLASTPTFAELNSMKAKVLESGVEGTALCWVMTKSMEAILEGTPVNQNGIYRPICENHVMCGLPVYTSNVIRKKVVKYKKYSTTGSTWSDYTLQANDKIDYYASGDSEANALASITSPANGKIAEVTILTEFIGLGDWRYQPMGLFGTLRFTVDPYSKARQDAVDFVLNADYGTTTLRSDAFLLGKVSAVTA